MLIAVGRVRVLLDTLRGSYWLAPALMGLSAIALAVGTQMIDERLGADGYERLGWWMRSTGPEGARAVLTTIAASMMTLASLTYSLTLVALTLAAGQYGPRLLRTFMRDRVTQISLGAFLATFLFSLVALRTVSAGPGTEAGTGHVPYVAVATSMALAALSLANLVYFIHHVASSIHAASVVLAVSRELLASISKAEPSADGADDADAPPSRPLPEEAQPLEGRHTGYVTVTDLDALVAACAEKDVHLWLAVRPGDFVLEGEPLAFEVQGAPPMEEAIRQAVVVGPERTMIQDTEFGVAQLVEVALRALSPGINDPFTAIACVDRLSDALVRLAGRPPVRRECRDENGRVRVTRLRVPSFDGALRAAFDPLRQSARGHVAVLIRLAEALGRIARAARGDKARSAVARQLQMIAASARDSVPEPHDRDDVLAAVREASTNLGSEADPGVQASSQT